MKRSILFLSTVSCLGIIYLSLGNWEIQEGCSGSSREDTKWAGKFCYDFSLIPSLSLSCYYIHVLCSVQSLILVELLYWPLIFQNWLYAPLELGCCSFSGICWSLLVDFIDLDFKTFFLKCLTLLADFSLPVCFLHFVQVVHSVLSSL